MVIRARALGSGLGSGKALARLPGVSLLLGTALALAGCTQQSPDVAPVETKVPKSVAQQLAQDAPLHAAAGIGTPLEQRVATIGLLNKRNNISQDVLMKPGETRRIGNVILKLSSCERTPPWETPPETGAFVQVWVQERNDIRKPLAWHSVFSGWLFKNAPSLNVVEHPVYDVWVKDCAMNFPGDDQALPDEAPAAKPAAAAAPAPDAPAADAAPAAPVAPAAPAAASSTPQ